MLCPVRERDSCDRLEWRQGYGDQDLTGRQPYGRMNGPEQSALGLKSWSLESTLVGLLVVGGEAGEA